jgi:hypothetical protein
VQINFSVVARVEFSTQILIAARCRRSLAKKNRGCIIKINYATSQRRLQNALENKYSNGTRRRVRFLCPLFSSLALSHKML